MVYRKQIANLIPFGQPSVADQILSIPITRPCRECVDARICILITPWKANEEICPTCNGTGEEATTFGKLAEEWKKC